MAVFWDVMPYSLVGTDWRCRNIYGLHHQSNEAEHSLKRQSISTKLRDKTSQKTSSYSSQSEREISFFVITSLPFGLWALTPAAGSRKQVSVVSALPLLLHPTTFLRSLCYNYIGFSFVLDLTKLLFIALPGTECGLKR
jgi:hypothetical protein